MPSDEPAAERDAGAPDQGTGAERDPGTARERRPDGGVAPGSHRGPTSGASGPSDPALERLVAETAGLQPWRRVLHAGNGILLATLLGLGVPPAEVLTGLLALGFVLLLGADVARLALPELNRLFFRLFRPLASPREQARIASSTWYVLGLGLVLALFPARTWIPSALVLALADPCASVVGQRWGRKRLGKGTVLGAAAFWCAAAACLVPFVGAWRAGAIGVVVALAEVAPLRVDDNVTVPVATAGLVALLGG